MSRVISKIRKRYDAFKRHDLTRDNSMAALIRYLRFNISQRLFPKRRIYKWIRGLRFYAEKGDAGIVPNIYYKLFDYEESMFLLNRLKPEQLFIDVGANVGHYSLLAAGGCRAKVIALEPIPETFEKLKANTQLNKLEELIDCRNLGVGDQAGALYFYNDRTVMNRVAPGKLANTLEVAVNTLDALLEGRDPTFIKIDVEGYELPVLKGAKTILANPSIKYLMLEFNESGKKYGYTDSEVYDTVSSYGFFPVRYLVEEDRTERLDSYNTHKFNTLFVRDDQGKPNS